MCDDFYWTWQKINDDHISIYIYAYREREGEGEGGGERERERERIFYEIVFFLKSALLFQYF